jgi:hypothetical protein
MNINWAVENKEFLGIMVSFLTVIIPFTSFILAKNKEQKQVAFEMFHKDLITGFVNQDKTIGLDQQIAIIYEMRNYPQYYPVIKRILHALLDHAKGNLKLRPELIRVIDEAEKTIRYTQKNPIERLFANIFPKD